MVERRLPAVNGDDGVWGDILNQFLETEHFNTGADNAANGGHQTITVRPGTTAANTAPIKLTSGPLMTAPEVGAIEFASDILYFTQTTNATRNKIAAYDDSSGAEGDTYYRDASGKFVRLKLGNANEILTVASGLPSWKNVTTAIGFTPIADAPSDGSQYVRKDAAWTTISSDSVTGPDTAVVNNIAFFDNTNGKVIKDSGLTITGSNTGDQDLSVLVPYSGATGDVSLGAHTLSARETDITDAGSAFKVKLVASAQTVADKTIALPNKGGTVAMLDDIIASGGDVLLASLYNGDAESGILICSQYNPED